MAVSCTKIEGEPNFAERNCCDCKLICKVAQKLCSSIFRYDYGDCIHCFSTGIDSPDYSLFSNREYQLHWMRAYLEKSAHLSRLITPLCQKQTLSLCSWEVQHYVPVCRRQNTFACNIIYNIVCIEVLI